MRTILLLGFAASVAGLSIACADDSVDTLDNTQPVTIAGNTERTEPAPSKKSDTTAEPTNTSTTPVKTTTPAKTDTKTCDPAKTKTKTECATCCAKQEPKKVVDSCACGATGKCTTACQDSLCSDKSIPSIECGICLFQQGCDLTEELGNIGTDAKECLSQCAAKE